MKTRLLLCAIVPLVVAVSGCCKPPDSDKDKQESTTASSGTAATDSGAALPPPPACKVGAAHVWKSGINKGTGITDTDLEDGRVAIGFAVGNQPRVLTVNASGAGEIQEYTAAAGEGRRDVNRVTPYKSGGQVKVAMDYHDFVTKDGQKMHTLGCGPLDTPILKETTTFFQEAPKDKRNDVKEWIELRDCRTFADPHKDLQWVVASANVGQSGADGDFSWSAYLLLGNNTNVKGVKLAETPLKSPPQGAYFEVPVSAKLSNEMYLLAVRSVGQLSVGVLNNNLTLRGSFVRYNGFPTLPDIGTDGSDMVLMTSVKIGKDFALRALRVSQSDPVLPKAYTNVVTDPGEAGSESDPDFTRDTNGQRWLAHVEGERGRGRLSVVPIDANFQAMGRAFTVTKDNEKVSFAKVLPMNDGSLLIAFMRESGGAVELVTQDLRCTVSK